MDQEVKSKLLRIVENLEETATAMAAIKAAVVDEGAVIHFAVTRIYLRRGVEHIQGILEGRPETHPLEQLLSLRGKLDAADLQTTSLSLAAKARQGQDDCWPLLKTEMVSLGEELSEMSGAVTALHKMAKEALPSNVKYLVLEGRSDDP